MPDTPTPPFDRLDFIYMPSSDVPRDLAYIVEILGGRIVFAVEGMGAKVAAVDLTGVLPCSCSPTTSTESGRSSSTASPT